MSAGVFAAPPAVAATPSKSPALVAADKLYETRRWREAERAYAEYARSANDASQYEAQLKTALCMVNRGETSRAVPTLTHLFNNASAIRDASDVVALACSHLYGIYLGQKNATPQRERLVKECMRKLPRHVIASRLCECEAVVWLKGGNIPKALGYLKDAGSGLSECGAVMLALLSSRGTVCDDDIADLSKVANSNGASWKQGQTSEDAPPSSSKVSESDPGLLSALCHALAARPDGWKAEFFLASFFAESGRASEAIAALDAMHKSGCGPAERVALFRAETLAFRTSRSDEALGAYKAWLAAYPSSPLQEKALYQNAQLLYTCGRHAEAVALIERQIAERPDGLYAKEGAEVLARCKTALAQKAEQEREKERQASTRGSAVNSVAEALASALVSGEKLVGEQKYALAAKELQKYRGCEADPTWGRGWFGFGMCLRETGDGVGAVRVWNEVWKRSLLFTNTLCGVESRLAMASANLEDFADAASALACLDDVARLAPDRAKSVKFQMDTAICHLALGHVDEAKRILGDLTAAFPGDRFREAYFDGLLALCDRLPFQLVKTTVALDRRALSRTRLGDVYFTAREHKKARRQYELAMNAVGDREMAAYCEMQAIRCTAALGAVDRALRGYDRFIVKFSKSSFADDVLLRAGVLWAGPKNNLDEAAKCFERIAREYPSGDQAECAAFYFATIAWWDKRWNDAEKLFIEFLGNYPNAQTKTLICDSLLPAIADRSQTAKAPVAPESTR